MSRLIALSDIHGCYRELNNLISKINPTSEDRIISLGDITDRGPEPIKCIELLRKIKAELVTSNHDDRYCKFFRQHKTAEQVMPNSKSVSKEEIRKLYKDLLRPANEENLSYLMKAKPFLTDSVLENGLTFLHAGVTPHTNLNDLSAQDYNQIIRARYVHPDTLEFVGTKKDNGVWGPEIPGALPWQTFYDGRYGTIVHGHNVVGTQPIVWINQTTFSVVFDETLDIKDFNVVSTDTGCYKGGRLTAFILDRKTGKFNFIYENAMEKYAD